MFGLVWSSGQIRTSRPIRTNPNNRCNCVIPRPSRKSITDLLNHWPRSSSFPDEARLMGPRKANSMAIDNQINKVQVMSKGVSPAEFEEMSLLGLVEPGGVTVAAEEAPYKHGVERVERTPMTSLDILNEAYDYERPSSFTRGLRVKMGAVDMLLISGTASIDDQGVSVHIGDFRAQCWRTYRNITRLLEAEGATWHDIVRTSCYLRDIERDYKDFNEVRTQFFNWLGLDPLPASTGIQVRLCREELLIEMEAMAVIPADRKPD